MDKYFRLSDYICNDIGMMFGTYLQLAVSNYRGELHSQRVQIVIVYYGNTLLMVKYMITNCLSPRMDSMNLKDLLFEENGTTCHTAYETSIEKKVWRLRNFAWSCDLNCFRLFVMIRVRVYAPQITTETINNIGSVIDEILPTLCGNVRILAALISCY